MSPLPGDHATPLSPQEQAAWDQATRSIDALAASLLAHDDAGVTTSLATIKSPPSVDMQRILNALHVPQDAGDLQAGLVSLLRRIPDGWGRWVSCSKGWYPLLVQTDHALSALDPEYQIHQVKEKYGTLSYYYAASAKSPKRIQRQMDQIVNAAEARSALTCEACGRPGQVMVSGGWYAARCYVCAALSSQGYRPTLISESHPNAALVDLSVKLPPASRTLSRDARQAEAYARQRAFEKRLESLLNLTSEREDGYCRSFDGTNSPLLRYTYLLHDEAAARQALLRLHDALPSLATDLQVSLVSTGLHLPPVPLTLTYQDPVLLNLDLEPAPDSSRPAFAHWLCSALGLLEDNLLAVKDLPSTSTQWTLVCPSVAVAKAAVTSLRAALAAQDATPTLRLAAIGNPPVEIA